MTRPLHVQGMWGLGDCIYQRAFVKDLCAQGHEVYLETPWPEIYEDLPVRFVRGERRLRMQMRNLRRQPNSRWHRPPPGARLIRVSYGHADLQRGSILDAMARLMQPARALVFDLPEAASPCPVETSRPIALVRPVTVRREWRNEARNCLPEHVAEVADRLRDTHHVVLVGSLHSGEEWQVGALPRADTTLLAGQLDTRQLLALARHADVITGPVGWIVPAAVALQRRAFFVLGGHGMHNAPAKILPPAYLDSPLLGWATPDNFCTCSGMMHQCDKKISSLHQQFDQWTGRAWTRPARRSRQNSRRDTSRGGRSLESATIP